MKHSIRENNIEGYNQVASTLYAAALITGIKHEAITRVQHHTPVEYIDPGLDAIVFGNTIDFRMKNTLGYPIVIFADVKGNKIEVNTVGKKQGSDAKSSLNIELIQKEEPTIRYVESSEPQQNQTKIVSQGKNGVRANVYRVTVNSRNERNNSLLYSDEYKAVETIIGIGPDSRLGNTAK